METKSLSITCAFPVVDLGEVRYRYSKVGKISGTAFMLLVIIDKGNEQDRFVDILKDFGVHMDLIPIFQKGLQNLYEKKMIVKSHITKDCSVVGFWNITDNGRKLLRDRLILDGDERFGRRELSWNCVEERFDEKTPKRSEEVVKEVESNKKPYTTDRIRQYFDSIKQRLGLKDMDRITSVDELERVEVIGIDKVINIEITAGGGRFMSDKDEYVGFLTDYSSSEYISSKIGKKYGCFTECTLEVRENELDNVNRLLCVKNEFENQLKGNIKPQLILLRRGVTFETRAMLLETDGLEGTDMVMLSADRRIIEYRRCRVNVKRENRRGQDFVLDAWAEIILQGEKAKAVAKKMSAEIIKSNINVKLKDKLAVLKSIASITGCEDDLEGIAKQQFKIFNTLDNQVLCLNELWTELHSCNFWSSFADFTLSCIFDNAPKHEIGHVAVVLKKMSIGLPNREVIRRLYACYANQKSVVYIAEQLLQYYNESDVLSEMNPIPSLLDSVLKNEPVSVSVSLMQKFEALRRAMTENDISNLINVREKLNEYRDKASTEFGELDMKIEQVLMGLQSVAHPAEWTKDQFVQLAKISPVAALPMLQSKAESLLRKALDIQDNMDYIEILNRAKDASFITGKIFSTLDAMRKSRNDAAHAAQNNLSTPINLSKINEWIDDVFSIGVTSDKSEKKKRRKKQ